MVAIWAAAIASASLAKRFFLRQMARRVRMEVVLSGGLYTRNMPNAGDRVKWRGSVGYFIHYLFLLAGTMLVILPKNVPEEIYE